MFWYLHLCYTVNVNCRFWNLISNLFISRCLILKISFAPVSKFVWSAFIFSFNSINIALLCSLNLRYLLFCLGSLDITNIFILLFGILINFSGALVTCFTHLLPHNLAEGTVASAVSENTFRFFLGLLFSFLLKSFETWLAECSYNLGLPLNAMKCVKYFSFAKKLSATRGKYIYHIIHFDSLIKDACHKVDAVGSPFNANTTVALCFTNLS